MPITNWAAFLIQHQIIAMWDGHKTHNARVAAWENVIDAIKIAEIGFIDQNHTEIEEFEF